LIDYANPVGGDVVLEMEGTNNYCFISIVGGEQNVLKIDVDENSGGSNNNIHSSSK